MIVFLIAFLLVSFVFISPHVNGIQQGKRSSSLNKIIRNENGKKIISYVDAEGNLTVASDLGYASIIKTETDKGILEEYLDAEGNFVKRSDGYYAVLKAYNNGGQNTKITYLDQDRNPMIINGGFATEEQIFDDVGQLILTRYYGISETPINTPAYGYGKLNEYDENGKIIRITYIDEVGNPMISGLGYASVTRSFYTTDDYQNGKVEYEFYFDADGNPVSLSLGQYGIHKEYDTDGQISVLTYLDAGGNPTATTEGYAIVKRTYHANNYVATERYFDTEGKPYALSEGQYGIKRDSYMKIWYLDANGRIQLNIKKLLYNNSSLVIVVAGIIVILSALLSKWYNFALLLIYLGCIVYITLLFREIGSIKINFEPFWSYKQIFNNDKILADILRNIWMFIPLGAILYKLYPRKTVLFAPILLSVLIELTQYFNGTGLCELDDVFSNGLGGAIGYTIGRFLSVLTPVIKDRMRRIRT